MSALEISPGLRDADVFTVRRARKGHRCAMPVANPVVEVRNGDRVRWQQRHPDRPHPYRRWDGGPVPDGCNRRITAGSHYVEYFGETPAFQSGYRFCAECAIAAGLARKAVVR